MPEKSKRMHRNILISLLFCLVSFIVVGFDGLRPLDFYLIKGFQKPEVFCLDTFFASFETIPYTLYHRVVSWIFDILGQQPSISGFIPAALYFMTQFFIILLLINIFEQLFSDSHAALLGAFFYSINLILFNIGASPLNFSQVQPNFVVRPFLLLAIYLFLKGNWGLVLIIIGISLYIHFINSFFLFLILVPLLIRRIIQGRVKLVQESAKVVTALLIILPLSIYYFNFIGNLMPLERWELKMTRYMVYGHTSLFYYLKYIPVSAMINVAVLLSLGFIMFYWGRKWLFRHNYGVLCGILGIVFAYFFATGIIVDLFAPRILISAEGLKGTIWLFQYISLGILAWFIVKNIKNQLTLRHFSFRFCIYLLIFISIISGFFFKKILFAGLVSLTIFLEVFLRRKNVTDEFSERASKKQGYGKIIFCFLLVYIFAMHGLKRFLSSNERIKEVEWKQVMEKVNQMSKDSFIMYPVEKFDEFYVYAHRSGFFDMHIPTYNRFGHMSRRITLDVFRILNIKNKIYFESELLKKWQELNRQQIQEIKELYPVTHIIRYKHQQKLPYRILYENGKYMLYDLSRNYGNRA